MTVKELRGRMTVAEFFLWWSHDSLTADEVEFARMEAEARR